LTVRLDLPGSVRQFLESLVEGLSLAPTDARLLFDQLFDAQLSEAQVAAVLVAMRMKGETAGELAAAAESLRARMLPFSTDVLKVLDTCGTGGDGSGTFNISTAVAFVAAGAGVPVVKHGNRAASGRSGSADVLKEMGIPAEAGPDWSARCFQAAGLAFCFAPHYHPALIRLADLRRRLGVRTILNSLGPLANPSRPAYQLIGVSRPGLLDSLAGAVAILGVERAVVLCGAEGFDEVSLMGATDFRLIQGNNVQSGRWTPETFGLEPSRLSELRASDTAASAAIIQDVLADRPGPAHRTVVANAAAAFWAADRVATVRDGVILAAETIRSGRARRVLDPILTISHARDS
jgi:anthranilate phosphoribosyltransferase